jgi:predicted ribosomally synthesized peptide with nif11-like leader
MSDKPGTQGARGVREFIEAVNNSPELTKKVRTALDGSSDPGPFVALAKTAGFEFTADEAREHFQKLFSISRKPAELSDEELERVAGGKGGGTLIPDVEPLNLQAAVNMMKSMNLNKTPNWTGFQQ